MRRVSGKRDTGGVVEYVIRVARITDIYQR